MVASTPFSYPRERISTRVNGVYITAVSIGANNVGFADQGQYKTQASVNTALVLGLLNPIERFESSNPLTGETPASNGDDFNGVFGTNTTVTRNFNFRQSARVIYQHPMPSIFNGFGSGDVACFLLSVATQLRAMDTIAGRPTQKCVYAWQVYDK
jgi:hypothetical protein